MLLYVYSFCIKLALPLSLWGLGGNLDTCSQWRSERKSKRGAPNGLQNKKLLIVLVIIYSYYEFHSNGTINIKRDKFYELLLDPTPHNTRRIQIAQVIRWFKKVIIKDLIIAFLLKHMLKNIDQKYNIKEISISISITKFHYQTTDHIVTIIIGWLWWYIIINQSTWTIAILTVTKKLGQLRWKK